MITNLTSEEVKGAKKAFSTRRVPQSHIKTLLSGRIGPNAGDLVMATVQEIGSHRRIELRNGRRSRICIGDRIIVSYGNRYAPDQFEALVSEDLGPCELVAAGGIAARKTCKHERMREPTRIMPIGLLGDEEGARLNLIDYAIDQADGWSCNTSGKAAIPTILIAGTAMNAGKTMTSASLIHGLQKSRLRVAGIKATGTGAGGDLWTMADFGAHHVCDFTDAGLPSTYLMPMERIENSIFSLIAHAENQGCQIAVVEIADGLQHEETAEVLRSKRLRDACLGLVFAAYDSLGAQAGLQTLRSWGHNVIALSGQLTRSPLAVREAEGVSAVPVVTSEDMQNGYLSEKILNLIDRDLTHRSENTSSGLVHLDARVAGHASRGRAISHHINPIEKIPVDAA